MEVPLDFLEHGRRYLAHIYTDAPNANPKDYPVPVVIRTVLVDSTDVLDVSLIPSGGHAVRLVPTSAEDLQEYTGDAPAEK